MMDDYFKLVYCPKCGWTLGQNAVSTGFVNSCPRCFSALNFVQGVELDELREFCTKHNIVADWIPK